MRFARSILLILSPWLVVAAAPADEVTHLMRHADVFEDRIVFTYEGDLWLAPVSGGDARRITNHPGQEEYAKISPDGTRIAFSAEYDGGRDVYVMDARGGVPERLTYHPHRDRVLGWVPGDSSGEAVLFRSRREYPFVGEEVYVVPVEGGMPRKLPVDRAGLASLSPDGKRIAYNRISREDRSWKRYQGGMAQDLWIGTLGKSDFERVTEWDGTDNYPMWLGAGIYFTSDREHGTLNLYRYDPASGEITALTTYDDYDVRYPSAGARKIVYQYAESLHMFDLDAGTSSPVTVSIPSDRVAMRPEYAEVSGHTGTFGLSPHGAHLLLESRGEIIRAPVEEGEWRNLTRSPSSREKNGAWSPDGNHVAFLSDRSGEEELYLVDADGGQDWRQLTSGSKGFRTELMWSPDSKHIMFSDKHMNLNLVEVASGKLEIIDSTPWDDGWYDWGVRDYVWSPCSRFIAYVKLERSLYKSVFLYSLDTGDVTRVTGEVTSDWSPSFDPGGDYLYLLSNRTFHPIMGFADQNHVFLTMTLPYVVVLRDDARSPFAPARGSADGDGDEGANGKEEDKEDDKEGRDVPPTPIDVDGLERRMVPVPGVEPGNFFRLEATDSGFVWLANPDREFLKYQEITDGTTTEVTLHGYDLKDKSATPLLEGIYNYHLSSDRKKLVYRAGSKFGVVDAGKKADVGDGAVALSDIRVKVHKHDEYLQIFNEAWRVQRDWFYDPALHGVDWDKIGDKYRKFVPSCGDRADLNYLIREMISELNAGHTYVVGGESEPRAWAVDVGLLGADFEQARGDDFHRIAHIIPGNNWNPEERSPLAEPGCPVREGDYLIAIDGVEVRSDDNVFRHLEDKVGKFVTLEFNGKPQAKGAQSCKVKPIGSEVNIRYREWVENNRAKVDAASDGRIGYLHVPDMMEPGLIEFAREWYPRFYKEAFIIDDRYNAGGFVGNQLIDRLERRRWAMTKPREGDPIPDPERCFHGHVAVIINEDTGSNGEYFAEAIKRRSLATVIGQRTWGGAVGIEPHQILVDGGVTTPPQFAPFGVVVPDGWLIEGHGVEPEIEVQNEPGKAIAGEDTQLEFAVRFLLDRIASEPMPVRDVPSYPDKSKPGEGAGR